MTHFSQRISQRITQHVAAIALLFGAAALPCLAASSAASSASDSITTSVGSVSGSIQNSSASSTGDNKVAAGDYRIIEVTTAAQPAGQVSLKLQAVADTGAQGEFTLTLPRQAFEESRLAQGGVVTARDRTYGTEFAATASRQAFFLVLADDWYRELHTRAVAL